MLIELGSGAADGEKDRRWFRGDALELVVWSDPDGVRLYHLRYRGRRGDGVLEWRRSEGLFHHGLDDGEQRAARAKATPILTGGEPPDLAWVREQFGREGGGLDPELREHVRRTLASVDPPGSVV